MDTILNAVFGLTNPKEPNDGIQRFASIIGLASEKEQYYRELHAKAWPGVVNQLKKSNIQNYSIYVTEIDKKKYLFSYFEYVGTDFDKDMCDIAKEEETQKWWKETDPCQIILDGVKDGEHWKPLERVFLLE